MNQHSSIFSNTIAENNNDSSEASAFMQISIIKDMTVMKFTTLVVIRAVQN